MLEQNLFAVPAIRLIGRPMTMWRAGSIRPLEHRYLVSEEHARSRVHERLRLQFRAEYSNLFDHRNFWQP